MNWDIFTFAIAGLAILLSLLPLLEVLSQRWRLPLPILAAACGLMIGTGFHIWAPPESGLLLDTYDLWFLDQLALTPQNVVVVFLPPLLFEVTLGVDIRRLKQDLAVVFLMAVVAVVVTTLMAGSSLAVFGGLPLIACLLLGATIATTDPAAVVAIFRRIGAPRRLLIVLEGESLLNDAAAIALFVLFIQMLRSGAGSGPLQIAADFGYLFAIGGFVGFVLGRIASRLMSLMRGMHMAQISLSLALVYATYMTAELAFGASGVVAVVAAGLTLTLGGASRVSSEDWNALRLVWGQLGYWANGFILLIASALSPPLLLQLDWGDLALAAWVFVAALLARAAVLFGLLPELDRIGLAAPMTDKQKLLVWWGGIRGAVTLLLALSLAESSALPDGLGPRLAGIGIVFVFATLFLNGSSLAAVTRLLELDRLSASDEALRHELIGRTIESGLEHVRELAAEHEIQHKDIQEIEHSFQERLKPYRDEVSVVRPTFGDRLRTALVILANQERRVVRLHYDDGLVGRGTMRELQRVAEALSDAARVEGRAGYERIASSQLAYPKSFRLAIAAQKHLHNDWVLSILLARRFRFLFEWELVLNELSKFVGWRVEGLLGEDIADNLRELIESRQKAIRQSLLHLELQYPNCASGLRQSFVARAALRWESNRYDRLLREAIIGPDLHRSLVADLTERLSETYKIPKLDSGLDRRRLFEAVPIFQSLGPMTCKSLQRYLRVQTALPGDVILAAGKRSDAMIFVASGAVRIGEGDEAQHLGTGDFWGERELLRPGRRLKHPVMAMSYCRLLILKREDLRKFMRKHPGLKPMIEDLLGNSAGLRPELAN